MQVPWIRPSQRVKVNLLSRISHLDGWLLIALLALMGIGLCILYSASGQNYALIQKQIFHICTGLALMITIAQIPPLKLKRLAPWVYGFSILLLALVLILGASSKGAQRWLDLGFMRFQPSEIMKIALPLMIASFLDSKILPIQMKDLSICTVLILIPVFLVALQPDLGTSLLVFAAGTLVIFFAGINLRLVLGLITMGVISLPLLWMFMLEYQKKRVLTLFNPEQDPLGTGYHIIQSKIALGSGGLFGKGWLAGTQTQLDFLPEQNTDFIFSVLGEEFGLVGVIVLFSLYFFIIGRGLFISTQAPNTFARLFASTLIIIVFIYVFVNVGMVSGLLPVVGVPLPLISYGGTSMMTLMVLFGILMSIHTHKPLLPR